MTFRQLTNKELKAFILTWYDLIWGANPCYNAKDIINYDNACEEAHRRGMRITFMPSFN